MTFKVNLKDFYDTFLKPLSAFVAKGDPIVLKTVDDCLYTSAPFKGDPSNVFCSILKIKHDEDISLGILDIHKLVHGVHYVLKSKPTEEDVEFVVHDGELVYLGDPLSFKIQLMNDLLVADCEDRILNKDQILDYPNDVDFNLDSTDITAIKNCIAFADSNVLHINSDGEKVSIKSTHSSGTFHGGDAMIYEMTPEIQNIPFDIKLPSLIFNVLPNKEQRFAFNLERRVFLSFSGGGTGLQIYLSSELKN